MSDRLLGADSPPPNPTPTPRLKGTGRGYSWPSRQPHQMIILKDKLTLSSSPPAPCLSFCCCVFSKDCCWIKWNIDTTVWTWGLLKCKNDWSERMIYFMVTALPWKRLCSCLLPNSMKANEGWCLICGFFSALCLDTTGVRRELQPPPPAPAPHRPSTEQLQDPHHQGITVTSCLVSAVCVLLKSTGRPLFRMNVLILTWAAMHYLHCGIHFRLFDMFLTGLTEILRWQMTWSRNKLCVWPAFC